MSRKEIDMSSRAVTARLKLVSQMWRLSLALGKARLMQPTSTATTPNVIMTTAVSDGRTSPDSS